MGEFDVLEIRFERLVVEERLASNLQDEEHPGLRAKASWGKLVGNHGCQVGINGRQEPRFEVTEVGHFKLVKRRNNFGIVPVRDDHVQGELCMVSDHVDKGGRIVGGRDIDDGVRPGALKMFHDQAFKVDKRVGALELGGVGRWFAELVVNFQRVGWVGWTVTRWSERFEVVGHVAIDVTWFASSPSNAVDDSSDAGSGDGRRR